MSQLITSTQPPSCHTSNYHSATQTYTVMTCSRPRLVSTNTTDNIPHTRSLLFFLSSLFYRFFSDDEAVIWRFHLFLSHTRNLAHSRFISAWQHIWYRALYAIVRPSVCLSVTWVDQSKPVEVKIKQPSPQSSPMTLVSWLLTSPWNPKGKIRSGGAEWQMGMKNTQFSANKSPYLRKFLERMSWVWESKTHVEVSWARVTAIRFWLLLICSVISRCYN